MHNNIMHLFTQLGPMSVLVGAFFQQWWLTCIKVNNYVDVHKQTHNAFSDRNQRVSILVTRKES